MEDDYYFTFNYEAGTTKILYNKNKTIQSLLEKFLIETNSKMILDTNKITFVNKSKLINNSNVLSQKIHELFKPRKIKNKEGKEQIDKNFSIKVIETEFIIGGIK